ncbi:MAG: hypothetical protein XXXJIFNMEKO3_01555 [Candidatus Erwinia impunctatus]|nr:hypothetical protein XXXJIFNMEKO_01555 [Culicoides impunctatus]
MILYDNYRVFFHHDNYRACALYFACKICVLTCDQTGELRVCLNSGKFMKQ